MRTTKINEQFEITLWVSLIRLSKNLSNLSIGTKQNSQSQHITTETSYLLIKLIITALISLFGGFLSGFLMSNF